MAQTNLRSPNLRSSWLSTPLDVPRSIYESQGKFERVLGPLVQPVLG